MAASLHKLSLRDLTEIFLVRGFKFTHETVRLWESRFAPQITQTLKAKRKYQAGKTWHVDETYLKINGKQHYLYRAIDRFGNLLDVRLSKTRDLKAAKEFFKKTVKTTGRKPTRKTFDLHDSYPKAIRKTIGRKAEHRTNHYLNNFMEQNHRGIIYPMKGFKSFESAPGSVKRSMNRGNFSGIGSFVRKQRLLFKLWYFELKTPFVAA